MRTGKNVKWAIAEFSAILFVQFFVMKYIILYLGVGSLGIWSVLMSAAQVAGFFGMGTAAGMGRFLSIAQAKGNRDEIEHTLATVIYGTVPLFLFLAVALYHPLHYGLALVLTGPALEEGRSLIGYALFSYVSQTISSCFVSALTSLHFGFRKSQIAIVGCVFQAVLSVVLIRQYGLAGLAMAQITNYLFLIVVALYFLKTAAGVRLCRLFLWNKEQFKTVVLFGLKVQSVSITWAAFEMSIRFLMSRFGGVAMVGVYEVAYKVASQPRILMFFIGQNISPVLASTWTKDKDAFFAFYKKTHARLVFFAMAEVVGIVLCSPILGLIMFGHIDPVFLVFSLLTALGTACHISAIPSERAAVAIGVLKYNILGTVTALCSVLVLGVSFGSLFQGMGVACSVLMASMLAALTPIYFGQKVLALPALPDFRNHLDLKNGVLDLLKPRKA